MQRTPQKPEPQEALQDVLGYLNFSSGAPDPKFLASLNEIFGRFHASRAQQPPAEMLAQRLSETLQRLHREAPAFAQIDQAQAVLQLVFEHFLPHYRQYHGDLLYHQSDEELHQPFFLGRVFEAVLIQGPPWNETERIVGQALRHLNDYIGYRPVAVLETDQKIEPYDHEWVRPIPLYIAGAGVAAGRYEPLISKTWAILCQTDPDLLVRAWFDPEAVDELALDPRAYDFDHPVNNRPSYHFGQWDPHKIDNRGRFRRFVLQQVTLNALLARVEERSEIPRSQRLNEAAAVLAGTILMASGTTGSGPETHDSNTTLTTLLPHIAAYRDDFYQQLLKKMRGAHGKRLREEAQRLHQPFGAARQHLNLELARRRATQLQQVHLAQIFARMGYPDASMEQAQSVRVASARMLCQMYCRLTLGHRALDRHDPHKAAAYLPEIEALLHRAIQCGALVDPWNIVGFGGNFALFPAIENSVRDFRVDVLIELLDQIFALCARAWSEAAARDDAELEEVLSSTFARLASWWDGFATPTIGSVRRLVGKEQEISTNLVAGALNAWHKAGAAAGDIAFWRLFVEQFDSPKAFQLVVEALMERGDHVASMALLIQWLSQSWRIPLEDGDSSFHRLALRWLRSVEQSSAGRPPDAAGEPWLLVRKFFDFLEANADRQWEVPKLELGRIVPRDEMPDDDLPDEALFDEDDEELFDDQFEEEFLDDFEDEEEDDESQELYGAAYEDMSFRDSTDDGVEGEMLQSSGGATDYELESESNRLGERLAFLTNLARLWKYAASAWGAGANPSPERCETFRQWHAQAERNNRDLLALLESIHRYRLPAPTGNQESLVEYDRRRVIKESLMEQVVATAVKTSDAERLLHAAGGPHPAKAESGCVAVFRAVLTGNAEGVRRLWTDFIAALKQRPILYIPLSKGGNPAEIIHARTTQQMLRDLLAWLPRLGLIQQTCDLLQTAQTMEAEHPIGPGAVTEFDRLFETGHKAVIESIVASAESWDAVEQASRLLRDKNDAHDDEHKRDAYATEQRDAFAAHSDSASQLVDCLLQLTKFQLKQWLRHSRTLRLSVVEKVADEASWNRFVQFVERYGRTLFTQKFLNLGNIRGILHQGVDVWLSKLEDDPDAAEEIDLIEDLGHAYPRSEAIKHLNLALEAVVENYGEYRDYNSTTTQSDRGELFYTLIDFLRLRADYDRVAWKLKPAVLAHQIVVQRGFSEAAELWRRKLIEETSDEADRHQQRLERLTRRYGMRLRTVADRIAERFVRPLAIDRVRALVAPAMEEARHESVEQASRLLEEKQETQAKEHKRDAYATEAFNLLQEELAELIRDPTGVGFELPAWLIALEEEVTAIRSRQRQGLRSDESHQRIPQRRLTLEEVQRQLARVVAD